MSIEGVGGGGRVDPWLMARLGEEDRRDIRRAQVSVQRQIFIWAQRVDRLMGGSPGVQELVQWSPLLRNAVRGLPFSPSYEASSGARLSYTAVVTPDEAARIGGGVVTAAPNPRSPLDMPPGSSVLLRGQSLTGPTRLEGLGFGVRRTEGSTVEIIAGPVYTVENELILGIKYVPVDIRVEESAEVQDLRVARLALSTEKGRAAYDHEHAKHLGVGIGPLAVSWGGPDGSANITATGWEDGTADETWSSTLFGVACEVSYTRDAAGRALDDATTWRLVVPDVHETLATVADAAYHPGGAQRSFDGDQHVRYTFDADELMALQAAPNFLLQDLCRLLKFTGEAVPGDVSFRDAGG